MIGPRDQAKVEAYARETIYVTPQEAVRLGLLLHGVGTEEYNKPQEEIREIINRARVRPENQRGDQDKMKKVNLTPYETGYVSSRELEALERTSGIDELMSLLFGRGLSSRTPGTGPCLVAGNLETASRKGWEICPLADLGCSYAQVERNFKHVCSEDYSSCVIREVNDRDNGMAQKVNRYLRGIN